MGPCSRTASFTRVVARGMTRTGACARFHGEDRRGRPGARRRRTITGFGRSASSRRSGRTRTLPAAGVAANPAGAGLLFEPAIRLLQRVSAHRRPGGSRRRAPSRRLHLRVSERPIRRRHGARPRPGAGPRDRSRSTTTGCDTRNTDPTRTSRRSTASIRSSSCGTTTRSRTTRGVTAPRTTIPIGRRGVRAAARRGRAVVSSSGCRSGKIDRRGSLASTDRSRSAIWRIWSCSTRGSWIATSRREAPGVHRGHRRS